MKTKLISVSVCDSPDDFYLIIDKLFIEMGFTEKKSRDIVKIIDGKGQAYRECKTEEIEFIMKIANDTGVIIDPVYSGKALYYFLKDELQKNSKEYSGKNIMFWHTGGIFSMYEYTNKIQDLVKNDWETL